jgi:hypothetical protein
MMFPVNRLLSPASPISVARAVHTAPINNNNFIHTNGKWRRASGRHVVLLDSCFESVVLSFSFIII